jgi:hypothetical protein
MFHEGGFMKDFGREVFSNPLPVVRQYSCCTSPALQAAMEKVSCRRLRYRLPAVMKISPFQDRDTLPNRGTKGVYKIRAAPLYGYRPYCFRICQLTTAEQLLNNAECCLTSAESLFNNTERAWLRSTQLPINCQLN